MKINDIIREAANDSNLKIIGIMSGRYQPPHIGHMKSWQWMKKEFGDAFIATSDKVDPPKSPFNFTEKQKLFAFAGVPSGSVVQVKNPYMAAEIVNKYDKESTAVVFGVSEKDMAEDPRFTFKPKKDGSPSYLQPYEPNKGNLLPQANHAYVMVIPTFNFNVNGKPMKSATEFRAQFAAADPETQKKMITDLYGKYDEGIHQLLASKIQ